MNLSVMEAEDEAAAAAVKFVDQNSEQQNGQIRQKNNYIFDEEGNKLVWICPVCGMRFSSGRALGGHSRIHSAQKAKIDHKRPHLLNKDDSGSSSSRLKKAHIMSLDGANDAKMIYQCPCCEKGFVLLKALFGHMRSHPNRDWRGIQPPPTLTSTIKSSSGDSSTLSQEAAIMKMGVNSASTATANNTLRWQCKGKRGWKSTNASVSSSVSSYSDDDNDENGTEQAAFVLLTLRVAKVGKYFKGGEDRDDRVMKRKKQKKMRDLDLIGHDRYKCCTCNKSFPTHQALGGHRSSHYNKPAAQVIASKTEETAKAVGEAEGEGSLDPHHCELCEKTFASGQALGGHKRCHRTNDAQVEVPSAESSQQALYRVVHGFNLNEPAPLDEEDM